MSLLVGAIINGNNIVMSADTRLVLSFGGFEKVITCAKPKVKFVSDKVILGASGDVNGYEPVEDLIIKFKPEDMNEAYELLKDNLNELKEVTKLYSNVHVMLLGICSNGAIGSINYLGGNELQWNEYAKGQSDAFIAAPSRAIAETTTSHLKAGFISCSISPTDNIKTFTEHLSNAHLEAAIADPREVSKEFDCCSLYLDVENRYFHYTINKSLA